ncbi:cell division control protein 6 homolog [Cyprinodon tularosa]|uniref:cell division control protein 6 homolog n=1 Tax=Cyprinodon tularosa TaxID=77115 RepID=UPI0018E1FCC7|nr:cell division control protein 6 homolog [Cyprinodon tularosa]
MPRTRSQAPVQPTIPFPRRRSSKTLQSSNATEAKPPISPRRTDRPSPLSPVRGAATQSRLPSPPSLFPRRPAAQNPPPTPPCSPNQQARLPLSPRKRTGDDNGCNVPCSPPKLNRSSLASPRKLGFDENKPASSGPLKLTPPCQRRSPHRQETPPGSPVLNNPEKKPPAVRLFADKSRFQSVKQALHTAMPERLLSREEEQASIRSFLQDKVLQNVPASLYISGAPGTGKTACLNCILQEMKAELAAVKTLVVNCMTLRSSHAIFRLLAQQLKTSGGQSGLQRFLTAPGPTVLLVLDEMDQLDSKAQDVLYTIFEWPYLPRSRLCLIGIANALDLTDRILPRLQAQPHCRPLLLHFPPYSRQELATIIQDRLLKASAEGMLDSSAVQFCARKVSAVSGDARKALDICRRAVEAAEAAERQKTSNQSGEAKVGLPQVVRVLSEVYGDRMASQSGAEGESFPLQQKLLVCCLLLVIRSGKSREVHLGKLHEVYSRLCSQRQVSAVGQGECLALCELLESRGIFALKKNKEARLTKVFLKIEEKDVENALKDRTLLGSILAAGLPS